MSIRTTIHLDEELYVKLKRFIAPRGMSQFVNEILWEKIQQLENPDIETAMKEGYLAIKEDRAILNQEWQTVDVEGWPE